MMLHTGSALSPGGLSLLTATGLTSAGPHLTDIAPSLRATLVTGHWVVAIVSLIALILTVGKLLPAGSRRLRWCSSPVNRPLPEEWHVPVATR